LSTLARGVRERKFNWFDVTLVQKALWNVETQLDFSPDGADAGRLTDGLTKESTIKVWTC